MAVNPDYPRRISTLVLVDSPAKVPILEPALRRAGLEDFCVFVCPSPLMRFPTQIPPIGLDAKFGVIGRALCDELRTRLLIAWAGKAKRVLIASDVDEDGELLASDVRMLLRSHPQVLRVRLRSLSFEGVAAAFSRPEPVSERAGWAALARVVLARACRYVMGKRTGRNSGLAGCDHSGIVLAAMFAQLGPARTRLTLAVPARDAAGPFYAHVDADGLDDEARTNLARLAAASVDVVRAEPEGATEVESVSPWNHADVIFHLSSASEWSPDEIRHSMRRLYEAGRLSYPDAEGRGVGGSALTILERIADNNGFRFDASLVEGYSRSGPLEHESPHPVSDKIDITTPIALLGRDDAVLALVTRQLISCGQPHVYQIARPDSLPEWAKEFAFERTVSLWLSPVQRRSFASRLQAVSPGRRLIDMMRRHLISRPGNESLLADELLEGGIIDEAGVLSLEALQALSLAPPALRDALMVASAEMHCRAAVHAQSFEEAIEELLSALGLASEVFPVLQRR